jgi:hypothetical protein
MKIISFSLWGDDLKYNIGAVKNCQLAEIYYPDWICRFYVAENTPKETINVLKSKRNAEVIETKDLGNWKFTIKRFFPFSEENVDLFISRDCDSRISSREAAAVNVWMNSDKKFHIMKDHPYHGSFPILAGMFGAKKGIVNNINELIDEYQKENLNEQYHFDQIFLLKYIWPKIKDDSIVHDEFFNKKPFPTMRLNNQFVGGVFDENDNQDPAGEQALVRYLNK